MKFGIPKSIKSALITVTEQDIDKTAILLLPYGMQMNLPSYPILAITGRIDDQGDNRFTFVADTKNRADALAAGELSVGIPSIKTRIKFMANGDIHFINGSTDGGDFPVKYNELLTAFNQLKSDFNALVTAYNSHVHPVTTAPGTTGPTPSSGSSSSASMTSSKCSVIQIPNL